MKHKLSYIINQVNNSNGSMTVNCGIDKISNNCLSNKTKIKY